MAGRNWDRDLKEEDKRTEKREQSICAYPDLSQLEDEGTHRDRCHDFDGCGNRRVIRMGDGREERRNGDDGGRKPTWEVSVLVGGF